MKTDSFDSFRLNSQELPFSTPPYSYEYIAARKDGKWRIHDSQDNAVGSAETEAGAIAACKHLNRK